VADLSPTILGQRSPQELVRLALLEFRPGAIISTSEVIARVREYDPYCVATDIDLVNLIIAAATGQSMMVEFDHNEETAA
jgi:hypothetical protein